MPPLVIWNPGASGGRGRGVSRAFLCRIGATEVRATTGPRDAERLAREAVAEGFDPLVLVGGDGLLHEVVPALIGREPAPRVAVLPRGTGNDFARALGLPSREEEVARIVLAGRTRAVDVARLRIRETGRRAAVGLRYMVNVAVMGYPGRVARRANRTGKRRWRAWTYRRAIVSEMGHLRGVQTRIRVNGRETIATDAMALVVANGSHAGGGIPLMPGARVDDGELDLLVVPRMPAAKSAGLLVRMLFGQHRGDPHLLERRARSLHVEVEGDSALNVDGEDVDGRSIEFECLPGALGVLTGPSAPPTARRG